MIRLPARLRAIVEQEYPRFSDAGFEELLKNTRPGMSERDLGNLVERAYVGEGGTTFIHYIGVTSMKEPGIVVPPQFHSARRVAAGQVLRSFTVGAEPTPLYKRLHETGMTLEENMTVVVQPNVISPKDNAGAQVGELIRVTRTGFERLHSAPRGFFRA